jgi:outer membrane immunogenic protein
MRYVIIAIAAAGAATPAFAQEQAPFTGPHIEALGGYENLEGADGFAYGVGAGYDFQLGGAILGIEGEYSDSTTKERANDVFTAGDRLRVRTGRDLYVGARLGVAAGPKTMVYGKAGYTNARFRARLDDGAGTVVTDGSNGDGYRLGAGIEHKLNLFGPSGFAKVEYRYSNYKNLNVGAANVDIDTDKHQVMVGVGARF